MAISTAPSGKPLQLTRVRLRLSTPAEEPAWTHLLASKHPLGAVDFAGPQLRYVAEHEGQTLALVAFGNCAYHLADRDRWIGWSAEQLTRRRHFVVQNSRLLVLGEVSVPNLASRVLSLCTKHVPRDWQQRFGYAPLLLETFVDPVCHRGTCYQAAGWTKVGTSRGFRRDGQKFYVADSHAKEVWMKPLQPQARAWLRGEPLPLPWAAYEQELPATQVATRLGAAGLRSLYDRFGDLRDPRRRQGRRYRLSTGLAILFCAVLSGAKSLIVCAEFAAHLSQTQLASLRSWRHPKTRRYVAPTYGTLWRLTKLVDAAALERLFTAWCRDQGHEPQALAVDGKTLRATLANADGGLHAVSLAAHQGTPLFSTKKSPTTKARNSPPPPP
jgi:hypothetical protein